MREVSLGTWGFYMALRTSLRTIDLARAAGISVQQVRNYEALSLLPRASRSKSGYRLYDEHQMRRLRVVVLLREAGYPFKVIQLALDELVAGRSEKAIVAVEKRREELTRTSWSCIEALTFFQHYVSEFGPQHVTMQVTPA